MWWVVGVLVEFPGVTGVPTGRLMDAIDVCAALLPKMGWTKAVIGEKVDKLIKMMSNMGNNFVLMGRTVGCW